MKLNPLKLLLVEDNPDHSSLFMYTVRAACRLCVVTRLKHGQACVDYLALDQRQVPVADEKRPDLIFLDFKLPMVNGLELLQGIKRKPATADIPIIMLTSSRGPDLAESLKQGAHRAFQKPMEGRRMKSLLKEFCACMEQP